jgi:outer membrane scaffolding protein for murein synthesis (MipA/OmpV family)
MRALLLALSCLPSVALAQAADVAATAPAGGNGVSFTLGLGAQSSPGYFGAEDNVIGPTGSFALGNLTFGDISVGGGDDQGFGFGGSVRFISGRTAEDFPELIGLTDLDPSLELGGGLSYTAPGYEVFANLRYGVIGHESLVAEIGGDVIYEPTSQLTLSAGPRLLWGSEDYNRTYFGVTADEALASAFDAYEPGSGLVSAGIKAEANYAINDDWGITGILRYDQLRDDAAASPIAQSTDQFSGSLLITRSVSFGF